MGALQGASLLFSLQPVLLLDLPASGHLASPRSGGSAVTLRRLRQHDILDKEPDLLQKQEIPTLHALYGVAGIVCYFQEVVAAATQTRLKPMT